jgi:hypothetical protein
MDENDFFPGWTLRVEGFGRRCYVGGLDTVSMVQPVSCSPFLTALRLIPIPIHVASLCFRPASGDLSIKSAIAHSPSQATGNRLNSRAK